MNIKSLFNKPKIIALIGDVNQAKSMLLYDMISKLKKEFNFKMYSYGLKRDLGEQKVYSVEEIETIKDSIIIIDEFYSVFDLSDRKQRKSIENTLRLINHNNNILVLSGLPENFKKFIGAKIDVFIFKKCTIADFINGNRTKNICLSYKGNELGSAVLNIPIDEALVYDGKHFDKIQVAYLKQYDSKLENQEILCKKRTEKIVQKKCDKNKEIVNIGRPENE